MISIVPDTNVFVDQLDVLIGILELPLPPGSALCVGRTVLRELDGIKTRCPGARAAIRLLAAVASSVRVNIEGIEHDGRIEAVVASAGEIEESNNDDQIINYIFKQENPVLLTNDTVFALKCKTYRIPVLSPKGRSARAVVEEILSHYKDVVCDGALVEGISAGVGQKMCTAGARLDEARLSAKSHQNRQGKYENTTLEAITELLRKSSLKPTKSLKATTQKSEEEPACVQPTSAAPKKRRRRKRGKRAALGDLQADATACGRASSLYTPRRSPYTFDELRRVLLATLAPAIYKIMKCELGEHYNLCLANVSSLEDHLRLLQTQFHIFKNYVSDRASVRVQRLAQALREKRVDEAYEAGELLCASFKVVLPPK